MAFDDADDSVDRLRSLTAEMRTLLASDIRDSGLSDRFDPTSISSAAQEVSNALQSGWIIDDLTGQPAPGFKRLCGVLAFHLNKLRNLTDGTRAIGKPSSSPASPRSSLKTTRPS